VLLSAHGRGQKNCLTIGQQPLEGPIKNTLKTDTNIIRVVPPPFTYHPSLPPHDITYRRKLKMVGK